jgi:2-methylcitrate dehydratase PrpD
MASGLTHVLAAFAEAPPALPAEALRIAKSGFIDAIATMQAGVHEPVVRAVREFVRARQSSAAQASILLGTELAQASDAALVNGTAAHALDYDDVALGGQPSAVLATTALAEAESLDASGADALRAYIVGYEVWAELISRDPDAHHEKGWHPTAVFGTVAAAAASAHLHRLSAKDCVNAIAIAASMASGLVANFGSMTKPLHAGRAASCGIDAVSLTRLGLSASPDAIEHSVGFLMALSPRGRVDRAGETSELGTRLRILETGLSIKKYPMCYGAHRVIDGVVDLAAAHDLRARDVRAVHVTVGPAQAAMLRNHVPTNALEAKFSGEFAAAAAIVARSVSLQELHDDFVRRPDVQDLISKVTIGTVDTQCPIEPVFALTDRVRIDLADGTTLDSGDIRFARGNAKLPLRDEELRAKFMACVGDRPRAAGLFEQLGRLESLDGVRALRANA